MVSRQSQAVVSQTRSVQLATPSRSMPAHRSASNPKMGNQMAQRLLRDGVIQAKLTVNQPGDKFEQEADRVAETVMRMPEPTADIRSSNNPPLIQRVCTECEEELHRKPGPGSDGIATGFHLHSSEGQPLPHSERRFFESRFGHDFSRVRVHSGGAAEQSARDVNANAYTVGHNIVFGAGRFAPGTHEGRRLLAHELAHVVQQSASDAVSPAPMVRRDAAADEAAHEARMRDPRRRLPFMMSVWKARGLLDPPHLPKGVAPIPPLPINQRDAKQLETDLSTPIAGTMMGGAVGLGGAGAAPAIPPPVGAPIPPTTFAEGTGAFEQVAADVGTGAVEGEVGTGVVSESAGAGVGATLAGVGAGVLILTYESPSAPAWTDTMSQVTDGPYGSGGEASWEARLTPEQQRYIHDLWQQRFAPPPVPVQEPRPPTQPPPKPQEQPTPTKRKRTDVTPAPQTQTEPDRKRRRRRRCPYPTGLYSHDPIPMEWFKPVNDFFYPRKILLRDGTKLDRDDPNTKLPDGTPVGVHPLFWPSIGKVMRLIPQDRKGRQQEYKEVLADWGYVWGETMHPDHVQDLDWEGPDAFGNLWPYEASTNLSAGSSQNLQQPISFCLTEDGPRYVGRRIGTVKKMLYGRYFEIRSFRIHSE